MRFTKGAWDPEIFATEVGVREVREMILILYVCVLIV